MTRFKTAIRFASCLIAVSALTPGAFAASDAAFETAAQAVAGEDASAEARRDERARDTITVYSRVPQRIDQVGSAASLFTAEDIELQDLRVLDDVLAVKGVLAVAVVDVGDRHEPELGNFDHHQFPAEHPPTCALSLVLMSLGMYDDARAFCDWLETAEWFDTRGPVDTARWLATERETLAKLQSPVDITLLRRFAFSKELHPGDTLWDVMQWIGQDLIGYLRGMRERLDFVAAHAETWHTEADGTHPDVLFLPRTEPLPQEPSAGLPRHIATLEHGASITAMIYPDRRGPGYALARHNDDPAYDFTRIADCADVHFAHARGFVAKTTATDPARLRELLAIAKT